MSTPISQRSKLQGLELYAPRRANMQSEPASGASLQTSTPASAIEESLMQNEPNDRDLSDGEQLEAAHARLEDAIQDAIDNGRLANREEPAADLPQLPPAPQLRPHDKFASFALPTAVAPRHDHAEAQAVSRRRSLLDPAIMPKPGDKDHRAPLWLLRYALMVGGAAVVAYVIAVMPSGQAPWNGHLQDGGSNSAVP